MVAPAPNDPVAQSPTPQQAAVNTEEQQASATVEPNENDGAAAEDGVSTEQTSAISSGASPRSSAPAEADAQATNWVTPSAYVNLRDGPSSSSQVIGVIAKGTRLPVLDRKRGWVQVSNPETSAKGCSSGYVGGGHHVRSRKNAAAATAAAPQEKCKSSFWSWLTQ